MKKIAIVHGGTSTEHAVSTKNAGFVESALQRLGYGTAMIPYGSSFNEELCSAKPDMAWICVQGKYHGDGTVQGILDHAGIPYTGSRTMGAAIINDKIICKELFQYSGIRTPAWQRLSRKDYQAGTYEISGLSYPLVAKAPTQGYSFGIELIESPRDLPKLEAVFAYDDPILLEQFIPGHNATVGLLECTDTNTGEKSLAVFPPVGHELDGDRENYVLVKAASPAPVVRRNYSKALEAELADSAAKAFAVTRAGVYGRVDFRISCEDGLLYALEINAVPGIRSASTYASGASLAGIDFDGMIETIIHTSMQHGSKNV